MNAQTQTQKDIAAVTAVSKAREMAFNQADAEEIASYFAEHGVLMAPGKPATIGTEAVKSYYQDIFDAYEVELESYYEEVEVSGDMAYGRGEALVRLTPRDGGESTKASSKYLNILERQPDGSWLTTHDLWNDNGQID